MQLKVLELSPPPVFWGIDYLNPNIRNPLTSDCGGTVKFGGRRMSDNVEAVEKLTCTVNGLYKLMTWDADWRTGVVKSIVDIMPGGVALNVT
jgi:hypothetical protein